MEQRPSCRIDSAAPTVADNQTVPTDMAFVPLHSEKGLAEAVEQSHHAPVVLFKHSRTCGLSANAHRQLQRLTEPDDPAVYVIVVQEDRPLSNAVESRFGIRHESPQVIVLSDGAPVFDTSHGRVTAEAVRQAVRQAV